MSRTPKKIQHVDDVIAGMERIREGYEAAILDHQFLLTRLRDMAEKWREGDFDLPPYVKGKMDGCHQCADELLALIGDDDTGTGGAG